MLLGPLLSPLNSDTSAVRKLLSASAFITPLCNKGTPRIRCDSTSIQIRLHLYCSTSEIMTHIRPRGEILINSLHQFLVGGCYSRRTSLKGVSVLELLLHRLTSERNRCTGTIQRRFIKSNNYVCTVVTLLNSKNSIQSLAQFELF